jgi:O-antigen ligase
VTGLVAESGAEAPIVRGARPSQVVVPAPRRRGLIVPPLDVREARGRIGHGVRRIAGVLLALGLFTASWDRLANIGVASYNVKLPAVLLTLAFGLALVSTRSPVARVVGRRSARVVVLLAVAIVLYCLVRGLLSAEPSAAVAQVAALLTGAVFPLLAFLLLLSSRRDLEWSMRWFLLGAAVASAFGIYQLVAFYTGLPQGIVYTGVGIGGGFGRISSFNYEPAYFSYFLVLALGVYLGWSRLRDRRPAWAGIVCFGALLYLANVRAVPLLVIAVLVLLVLAGRAQRTPLLRTAVVSAAMVVVAFIVPVVVGWVQTTQASSSAEASGSSAEQAPDETASTPAGAAPQPAPLEAVDPAEQSSNAPRLGLYRAVIEQIRTDPVFGIGPGNLGPALRAAAPGAVQDQTGGQVVANNIWLQALADGGVPLLLLETALILAVVLVAWRRRAGATAPVAAGWLAVVLVGGMLTSYLFDLKVWLVLGMILLGAASSRTEDA